MPTLTIPITGGAYTHPVQDTNNQRCVNMFPTETGPQGRGEKEQPGGTLVPCAGLLALDDLGGIRIRGQKEVFSNIYVVRDNEFIEYSDINLSLNVPTFNKTTIGNLNTSIGNVCIEYNAYQIIIVDGSTDGYIYDFNTLGKAYGFTIGGTSGNTYNLTINGVAIYTNQNVAAALTLAALAAKINDFTDDTGVTASVIQDTSGLIPVDGIQLQSNSNDDIIVIESGTGFVSGVNGITISGQGNNFSTGTRKAFHLIDGRNNAFPGADTVVFLDQYFIINRPNSAEMFSSDLYEGNQWPGANMAAAEARPDNLVALSIHKNEIWAFGSQTIEIWEDTANATGFPFSRISGSGLDIGLLARWSVSVIDNVLMWLDQRGFVCQSKDSQFVRNNNSSYEINVVSTPALHAEWDSYPRLDDAIAFQWNDRGHLFYQITFPTAQKTWCYDYQANVWHERSYHHPISRTDNAHLIQFASNLNNKFICSGVFTTKLYLMNREKAKTDDGELIRCRRITAPFYNKFDRITVSRLELRMQTGAASSSEFGSNPCIMLRYSPDGGHTWSNELVEEIGRIGEYNKKVLWNRLGMQWEWVIEFSIVEPVDFALIDAVASITIEQQ